jgi:hypothetical protein
MVAKKTVDTTNSLDRFRLGQVRIACLIAWDSPLVYLIGSFNCSPEPIDSAELGTIPCLRLNVTNLTV